MKAENQGFFAPQRLKATIFRRDTIAMSLKLPHNVENLSHNTDENTSCSLLERRFGGIKPYISELHFDVRAPAQQTTILAKMSPAQVKRQKAKAEARALKQRRKQSDKIQEEESKNERKLRKRWQILISKSGRQRVRWRKI